MPVLLHTFTDMNKNFLKHFLLLLAVFLFGSVSAQKKTSTGLASYYADKFEGRRTSSGEIYRHSRLTAAHRTFPFGTKLKVTNVENGKSVIVKVNDRGPFVKGRIIDLSKSAATKIDLVKKGIAKVRIEPIREKTTFDNHKNQSTNEYYRIDVASKTLSGYGVQIGSFNRMDNLIRLSHSVKKIISGDIYVLVVKIKGKTINRLIVGIESNRSKADRNRKRLKNSFPGCFVVQL
jgi:rare lipoprotein A